MKSPISRHLFLSPHLDDAVLSCGGWIAQLASRGREVTVATLCAGQPPSDGSSRFASSVEAKWEIQERVVEQRREEDFRALAELGDLEILHLSLLDCIYRRDPVTGQYLYQNDEHLFGPPRACDLALFDDALDALMNPAVGGKDVIYAPLAVGNHVDHQLLHRAAEHLLEEGHAVVFYEDYPYADPHYPYTALATPVSQTLELTLRARRRLVPVLRALDREALSRKTRAAALYRSQLPVLFGDAGALRRRIEDYARRVGEGIAAERYWADPPGAMPR